MTNITLILMFLIIDFFFIDDFEYDPREKRPPSLCSATMYIYTTVTAKIGVLSLFKLDYSFS